MAPRQGPESSRFLPAGDAGPGLALRGYGLAELAVAIDGLAAQGTRVHEGIHQARKAIRRTRAVLSLGATTLGPGACVIDRQLRKVNMRLSNLRDAHALVETLDRLAGRTRNVPTLGALRHAHGIAMRQRACIERSATFAQTLQAERAMLAMLRAALDGLPWQDLSTSAAMEAMAAAADKAKAARARAFAHDDDVDWHLWRRSMRRISQQHHAMAAIGVDVSVPRFDKTLTERLGAMQDLVLLIAHCDTDAALHEDSHALRRFAGKALERQRERLRARGAH